MTPSDAPTILSKKFVGHELGKPSRPSGLWWGRGTPVEL